MKRPTRVLHVLGTAQPEWTAIVRVVRDLATAMDPAEFAHEAVFLGEDGPLRPFLEGEGVRAWSAPWAGGARNPLGALRFARQVRWRRPDLLHVHFGGRSVRWTGRRASGAAVLMHLHSRIDETRGLHPVAIHAADADAAVADSHAIAAQVHGIPATVVHLGVRFPPPPLPSPPRGPDLVIGTSGRLAPVKGLDVLLDAFARVASAVPHLRLEIAGEGSERAALEARVRAARLGDRVRFLGWVGDVAPVLAGWDLLAQPSVEEGFPTGVLEGMAAGLPVVASAVGGLPEMIEEGVTGWLVPPRDVERLAERLVAVAADPAGLRTAGHAAAEVVRRRFTVERMAAGMAALYREVLAGRARGAR